jgi:predicted nicotinamide N-methyase
MSTLEQGAAAASAAAPPPPAPPPRLLALPGPQYDSSLIVVAGHELRVEQEGGRGRGTGWSVWDGAVASAHLLGAHAPALRQDLAPPAVLELGAGTGLASLAAAAALALPVTATDLPAVLPSLQRNVAAHAALAPLLTVAPLDWTAALGAEGGVEALLRRNGGPFGLVLAADCTWLEALVEPLVRALAAAVAPGTGRALLAHQRRSRRVDAALFAALEARFVVAPAPAPAPGEPPRGVIELYWLTPLGAAELRTALRRSSGLPVCL